MERTASYETRLRMPSNEFKEGVVQRETRKNGSQETEKGANTKMCVPIVLTKEKKGTLRSEMFLGSGRSGEIGAVRQKDLVNGF